VAHPLLFLLVSTHAIEVRDWKLGNKQMVAEGEIFQSGGLTSVHAPRTCSRRACHVGHKAGSGRTATERSQRPIATACEIGRGKKMKTLCFYSSSIGPGLAGIELGIPRSPFVGQTRRTCSKKGALVHSQRLPGDPSRIHTACTAVRVLAVVSFSNTRAP
jgi:hypothetical protein